MKTGTARGTDASADADARARTETDAGRERGKTRTGVRGDDDDGAPAAGGRNPVGVVKIGERRGITYQPRRDTTTMDGPSLARGGIAVASDFGRTKDAEGGRERIAAVATQGGDGARSAARARRASSTQ